MYDAIIVGARCGGSPTAMLLARKGYKVLMVDRASFPSDTLSTHFIQQPGIALLNKWGLLDDVLAETKPFSKAAVGTFEASPSIDIPEIPGVPGIMAPRRPRFDKLLQDAAVEAGAELRERFTFEDVIVEDGRVVGIVGRDAERSGIEERARIVIGADGRHSQVAEKVGAEMQRYIAPLTAGAYSYWSGYDTDAAEVYFADDLAILMFPTDNEQTVLIVIKPVEEFDAMRRNLQDEYVKALRKYDVVGDRLSAAKQEEWVRGGKDVPNFFRACAGPGWALVGDAAYHKDPVPADGITDAFLGVELLVEAVDGVLSGSDGDEALKKYETRRDEIATPHFETCLKTASFDIPAEKRAEHFIEHATMRYFQGMTLVTEGAIT